ncbi:hypothetical protein CN568_28830 [Bacillus pseudomycoides]|nr:hypothetical protein CON70_25270 [Bacillus pseudomycoides]PDZ74320.1 hypothetical protein CON58_07475 [Bacillus pseudomycoides]PEK31465.1 hypothetical protein CN691_17810 [Bacillus pseudomycoides]PEK68234.1 hypothetical protein CN593_12565 [Bacillus pseudomycoides]PEP35956.1 hypothetical protein CN565_28685 [Bacillus pseudomycoides]
MHEQTPSLLKRKVFNRYIYCFLTISVTAMKTKGDLHSLYPFVFTWYGIGKGTDRFYAWADALSTLKRKVLYRFFNLYLYILLNYPHLPLQELEVGDSLVFVLTKTVPLDK